MKQNDVFMVQFYDSCNEASREIPYNTSRERSWGCVSLLQVKGIVHSKMRNTYFSTYL